MHLYSSQFQQLHICSVQEAGITYLLPIRLIEVLVYLILALVNGVIDYSAVWTSHLRLGFLFKFSFIQL
jgi:hypothetical protein